MDLRAIAMGLVFAFAWSSAFTSARIIVAYAPPITTLGLRFLISGLLALLIAWALGQSFRLTRAQARATLVFGICQNALYLGLNFVAMQWIEASLAAIIASTMPLIVALASWLVFREKLPPLGVVGLMAGVLGAVLIMGSRLEQGVDLTGVAFCIVGVIALAVATLTVRGASSGGNLLVVVGYQMFVGSAILAVIGLATEPLTFTPSWQLLGAFVYTTLVPGLAATWIWFALVGRIGATRAATFHFLNPVFGVAVAAALLGEQLRLIDVVGVGIVTFGILAVQLARRQTKPA
jgi:drug/metabolite transporter (DMT)-like permease